MRADAASERSESGGSEPVRSSVHERLSSTAPHESRDSASVDAGSASDRHQPPTGRLARMRLQDPHTVRYLLTLHWRI